MLNYCAGSYTFKLNTNDYLLMTGEGDVAQLGERRPRTAEVSGSIPLISTKLVNSE